MTRPLQVELVYAAGCPQLGATREALRRALTSVGAPVTWREWRRDDPEIPGPFREFASPTVVINGRPVGGPGAP